jgi:HK97 gp10 family phage protein
LIQIEVQGEEELRQLLEKAPREIRKAAHEVTAEIAEQIKSVAERICPVRTGYLRSTIFKKDIGFMECAVGVMASYAVYVEFGTSHMAPRSFLRPAVVSVQHEFAPTLARKVEEYLRSL